MNYDLQNIEFRPKRAKMLWNWNVAVGELVTVLPNTLLQKKTDVSASIEGRCLFASPREAVRLENLIESVERALIEDTSPVFFLCGFMDYAISFGVTAKDVLDDIENIIKLTRSNPEFLQDVIQTRLHTLFKAFGFSPPMTSQRPKDY